ncbi:MAG: DUF3054 domain-containing protein [Chloroflexi bacterium]|nr:MAG: DUF3054 domain-containing protein [Chloroflexota bacterium]
MTAAKSLNSMIVIAGDIVALLLFAAIGRQTHSESNQFLAILSTGLPFIISWLTVSALLGLQRPQPFKRWIIQTLSWAPLSALMGLALRAIWLEREIPLTFAIITVCVTTFALLVVRVAFSLRTMKGNA